MEARSLRSRDFVEKLRLKEMADEDIYFARRDLELIEALRKEQPTTPAAHRDHGNRGAKGSKPEIARSKRTPGRLSRAIAFDGACGPGSVSAAVSSIPARIGW